MSIVLNGTGGTITGVPGQVLQVVNTTSTTYTAINTNTYTDTGLSLSITPTSSTSKILIMISQPYRIYNQTSASNAGGGVKLLRGSTAILVPVEDSGGPYQLWFTSSATGPSSRAIWSCSFLDSPATTSSTTYKTQARRYDSNSQIVFQEGDSVGTSTAMITLMEIAA